MPAPAAAFESPVAAPAPHPDETFSNLDYLAETSLLLANLEPDKDGLVKIRRADLGSHGMIQVVALDPLSTTSRSVALAEPAAKFLDLRLAHGLDPKLHFTQQQKISLLLAGKPFVLPDATSSRFEAYDSLARAYGLFATLSKDPKLAEFAFILNWPKLKAEEKRAQYSKYACHELTFFLARKDPEFFQEVIKPYLANKKDKTFVDRWLLGENLNEFLLPWNYERLNTVERVLLAQHIAGEPSRATRYLNDVVRLQPPNGDRLRMLFETGLKGNALAARNPYGLVGVLSDKEAPSRLRSLDAAAPAGPAGAPGGGGGRGSGRGGMGFGANGPAAAKPQALEANDKQDQDLVRSLDQAQKGQSDRKKAEAFFEDARKDGLVRQLFRNVDATQEWAEDNYYHLPIEQQLAGLVGASQFWLDYVKYDNKGGFLSTHFADASHNFTEMMFALSVLDLPFEPAKHQIVYDAGRMTFTPGGPAIAFHEEVRPVCACGPANKTPILVRQSFYRVGDQLPRRERRKGRQVPDLASS